MLVIPTVDGGRDIEELIPKSILKAHLLGLLPSLLALCLLGLRPLVEELLTPIPLISETIASYATSPVTLSLPSSATVVNRAGAVFNESAECCLVKKRFTLRFLLLA